MQIQFIPHVVILSVSIVLGELLLTVALKTRDRETLRMAVLCFAGCLFVFALTMLNNVSTVGAILFWDRILYVGALAFGPVFLGLVAEMVGISDDHMILGRLSFLRYKRITYVLAALGAIAAFTLEGPHGFLTGEIKIIDAGWAGRQVHPVKGIWYYLLIPPFTAMTILVGVGIVWHGYLKKGQDVGVIALCTMLFLAAAMNDSLIAGGVYSFSLAVHFGFFVLLMAFAKALVRHFLSLTASTAKAHKALSKHIELLHMTSHEVAEAAATIDDSTQHIRESSEEQNRIFGGQVERVQSLLHKSKKLNEDLNAVLRFAAHVRESANQALEKARYGETAIRKTVDGIAEFQVEMESSGQRLEELSAKAQEIGSVVKLIDKIAEDTEIIAFNAALEAAGAGPAGRRFSIVARQVRDLAESIFQSLPEIDIRVAGIQQSVEELVQQMRKLREQMKERTLESLKTGRSFQEILQMMESTTNASDDISVAIEMQTLSGAHIQEELGQTSEAMSKSRVLVESTTNSLSELARLSSSLARSTVQLDQDASQDSVSL